MDDQAFLDLVKTYASDGAILGRSVERNSVRRTAAKWLLELGAVVVVALGWVALLLWLSDRELLDRFGIPLIAVAAVGAVLWIWKGRVSSFIREPLILWCRICGMRLDKRRIRVKSSGDELWTACHRCKKYVWEMDDNSGGWY